MGRCGRFALVGCLIALGAGIARAGEQSLSFADLVGQMTDLERLAALPQPGETNAMWASTDRRSQYDAEKEAYVNWAANGDGNGFIRKEGKQLVMAEMDGPGVLWRIWSARPQDGHVKVYLDGAEPPVLDMPFAHYFDAKHEPFVYPSLGYVAARGQNLYFPIPYQESCKIVADPGWGRYYQFTYTTYPEGTQVPTFTADLSEQAIAALKKVDTYFRERRGMDPAPRRKGQTTLSQTVAAAPGKTAEVARLKGPRAIVGLRARLDFADREDQMAGLRHLVLRIVWDGAEEPAVWCPLGDFFGTAPGENHYKSLPLGMTEDGYYSLWYMPFAESAVVELVNDGEASREVQFEITHAPLGRPFEGLGHFHAKWHRDVFPLPEDRWPDWTLLKTQGRGRFCGVMLHVWNARGGWWGEGDEKFFVDGEDYPSTFGTGSEDYFGYAWGNPSLFDRPYHGQTMTENNRGHQSLYRWQIADNVPFQSSFEGCIEKYFRNQRGTLYACSVYWYLAPGGTDPFGPVPADERHGYYESPPLTAGGYKILGKPRGNVRTQGMSHFKEGTWTNDDHLWWTGAKPGDTLDIAFKAEKAGRYEIKVILTKARDYAIVQPHVDGEKAGEPIDLYNPEVVNTEPLSLGVHELTRGQHKLTLEITGANEEAEKAYMVGLDEIVLEPAK
jgi:hypothetical protein